MPLQEPYNGPVALYGEAADDSFVVIYAGLCTTMKADGTGSTMTTEDGQSYFEVTWAKTPSLARPEVASKAMLEWSRRERRIDARRGGGF